jgi:methyltransferase, FkbM family
MDNKENGKISIHHIGGRSGSREFPILDLFERDFINVLYDADVECIEQIKEYNENLESELYVLPYCVGNNNEIAELNIMYDPYSSSLRELNDEYKNFYIHSRGVDYIFSDTVSIIEKRKVDLVTLDWIIENNTNIPKPDFISMDTQGTEYEIIQGGMKTIKENVVGLVLECGFHEIYKDQKLFGEITKILSDNGFYFVKFMNLETASPYRAPIELRGEGFNTGCDALFLRKISNIQKLEKEDIVKRTMLQKLAFISIVFNQYEYGIQCLNSIKLQNCKNIFRLDEEKYEYITFLEKLEVIMKNLSDNYPKTFTSEFTIEQSKARFKAEGMKNNNMNKVKSQMVNDETVTFSEMLEVCGLLVPNKEKTLETENYRYKKYYTMMNRWLKIKDKNLKIESYLINNNIKTIGIWGAGEIGSRLLEELENSNVKVEYFIDLTNKKEKVGTIPIITLEEVLCYKDKVDSIVITPIYDFEKINSSFVKKSIEIRTISLEEIIDELYYA